MESKVVVQQGLDEGEEEQVGGQVEVDGMDLCWMKACCTALELHAADSTVQVRPRDLSLQCCKFSSL